MPNKPGPKRRLPALHTRNTPRVYTAGLLEWQAPNGTLQRVWVLQSDLGNVVITCGSQAMFWHLVAHWIDALRSFGLEIES